MANFENTSAPSNGDIFGTAYWGAFLVRYSSGAVHFEESNTRPGNSFTLVEPQGYNDGYRVVDADRFAALLEDVVEKIAEFEDYDGDDAEFKQGLRWQADEAAGNLIGRALDYDAIEDMAFDEVDEEDEEDEVEDAA